MERKLILVFALALLSVICYKIEAQTSKGDSILGTLINQNDMLELNRQYFLWKDKSSPMITQMSKSLLAVANNKLEESCEEFHKLLDNHSEELGWDNTISLNLLLVQQLCYLSRYQEALDVLDKLSHNLPDTEISEKYSSLIEEAYRRNRGLKGFPKLEVLRPETDSEIPITIGNEFGEHIYVNTKLNGTDARFIFDTGASGYCYVSEPFAKEHNIRIVADSVFLEGIVTSGYGKIGVADSLQFGDITFRNVIFHIGTWNRNDQSVPDSVKDVLDKVVPAVIGRHLMDALGEVQIYPIEKKISFPVKNKTPMPRNGSNMAMIHGQPYLEAYMREKRLLFFFDTGAATTTLSTRYYNDNKKLIKLTAERDIIHSGGFGGTRLIDVYTIPTFPLEIGDINFDLGKTAIHVENNNPDNDGVLGMPFVQLFDKVTFDFQRMFIQIGSFIERVEDSVENEVTNRKITADEAVAALVNKGDYIELNRQIALVTDSVNPILKSIIEPVYNVSLNRHEAAVDKLSYMLNNLLEQIGYRNWYVSLFMLAEEIGILNSYGQAADVMKSGVEQVIPMMPMSRSITDTYNSKYSYFNALRDIPLCQLTRPSDDCTVDAVFESTENGKLMYIPVTVNGKKRRFLFDTGSNTQCYVSREFAEENNIRIVADYIQDYNDADRIVSIGVADSIQIGSLMFKNVVFTINPDEEQPIVLGRQLMDKIGEIQIYPQQHKIVFPVAESPMPANDINLINGFNHAIIEAYSQGERLLLRLNTGKDKSAFSPFYYHNNEGAVKSTGIKKFENIYGYENVKNSEIYVLPSVTLKVDGGETELKDVPVYTYKTLNERQHGELGMDYLLKQNKVILDFRRMFIHTEN